MLSKIAQTFLPLQCPLSKVICEMNKLRNYLILFKSSGKVRQLYIQSVHTFKRRLIYGTYDTTIFNQR